ncbi:plasmid recombination protein, partial [Mycobacterium tuberculosis]|nr:plasmid recombination protein [Mycobacterium tuberculosis]
LCIEYLITASPDWEGWGTEKQAQYLNNARSWLEQRHGVDNVAMVGIQLDESTPHIVAYVVPKDPQGKMNARYWLGGADKLTAMQTDFADKVGAKYGLERGVEGSQAKHQDVKRFYTQIQKPLKEMRVSLAPPKTFELSIGKYKERAEQEVSQQVTEKFKGLQNNLRMVNAQLKDTQQKLNKLSKETETYRKAKAKLPYADAQEFDQKIDALATEIQQQRKQEFEEKKQRELDAVTTDQKRQWTFDVLLHENKAVILKSPKMVDIIRSKVANMAESELKSPINPYFADDYKNADKFLEFHRFISDVKKSCKELGVFLKQVELQAPQVTQPSNAVEKVGQAERSGKGGGMDLG